MRTLILLLSSCLCAFGQVNATWTFRDFQQNPQAVKRTTLIPLAPLGGYNGAFLTASPMAQTTSGAGSVTYSNLVPGYSYFLQIDTPYASTRITNGFPTGLSGNVNAYDYRGVLKGDVFYFSQPNTNASAIIGTAITNTQTGVALGGLFTVTTADKPITLGAEGQSELLVDEILDADNVGTYGLKLSTGELNGGWHANLGFTVVSGQLSGNGAGVTNMPATGVSHGKLVIIDDDWPTDMDNIMELDFALKMMDKGLIKILATPYSGYGLSNTLAVPLADTICRYYGHPEIVQGASGLSTNLSGGFSPLWYNQAFYFSADIVTNHQIATYTNSAYYPTALEAYRSLLDNAASNSVTIVCGGPLANLWDLWFSGPDGYSQLSGQTLIKSRVSEIVIASGVFPTNSAMTTDNLSFGSLGSWGWLTSTNLGVTVTWLPLNESGNLVSLNGIGSGGTVVYRNHIDPTFMAYRDHNQAIYRPGGAPLSDSELLGVGSGQWTTMAILYVAYNNSYNGQTLFGKVPGNIYWRPDGHEGWLSNNFANGFQQYLVQAQTPAFYSAIFTNAFATGHPTASAPTRVGGQFRGIPAIGPLADATLDYWFRPEALTNIAGGSTVSFWADSSLNTNALLQAAGSNAPTYQAAQVNGYSALSYAASSSQFLVCSNLTPGVVFTMFAVVNPSVTALSGDRGIIGTSGSGNAYLRLHNGVMQFLNAGSSVIATANTALPANTWSVVCLTYDANGNYVFYLNGAVDKSGTNQVSPPLDPSARYASLGAVNNIFPGSPSNWQEFWDGSIAEAGRYPSVISTNDMALLVNYLGKKYGLSASIPTVRSNDIVNVDVSQVNFGSGLKVPASISVTGQFNGSGAGVTNLPVSNDGDALGLLTRAGISNAADCAAITGFITTLKAGGVWTNTSLVDVGFFKTNHGGGSNMTTLFGRACNVTNITYDTFGFSFSSSSTVVIKGLPDLRTNTLIAVVKSPGGADIPGTGGVQHMMGLVDGNGNSYEAMGYDNYGWTDFAKAGASSWANGSLIIWNNNESYFAADQKRRVVSCSFSNGTAQAYYDTWTQPIAVGGTTVSGTYVPAVPLTNLWIGGLPGMAKPLKAKVEAFVILSSANNVGHIQTVDRALRWLEPSDQNVIFVGDSQTVNSQHNVQGDFVSCTNGWAWKVMNGAASLGNECWWNEAESGSTINNFNDPTKEQFQRLTNRLYISGLGGPVKRLKAYVYLAANDLVAGASASSMQSDYSNVLSRLANASADVTVVLQHTTGTNASGSVAWSDAEDANRVTLNRWLAANPQLYTRLVNPDPIFTRADMSSTNISRDGLHLTFLGNQSLAQQVMAAQNGALPLTAPTINTNGVTVFSVMPQGGLRFLIRTNTPTGYELGAGYGALWCSNNNGASITFYKSWSLDGTNATTASY